jgi:hypothetical protein
MGFLAEIFYNGPRAENEVTLSTNLIDVTEMLATKLDLSYNRREADEIIIKLEGRRAVYDLTVLLSREDVMYFSCSLNIFVPNKRRTRLANAIVRTNEQMWLGHFDLAAKSRCIFYSLQIPFTSSFLAEETIIEDALKIMMIECDRFYHYFFALANGSLPTGISIDALMLESAGEA